MANTYTQILVQLVFAVQGRKSLILEPQRDRVEKFMCGIITNKKSKPLAIYCNPDHCHILIGLHPAIAISDMARDVKASSAKWINENNWIQGKFSWQRGFGAFTYSKRDLDAVVKYIHNQPKHHKKTTFREEYIKFLIDFNIDHDNQYLFDWI